MICQRFTPTPFVGQYIKEYLLVHLIFDKNAPAPVKAYPTNPEEGMTFMIKGSLFAESPELNQRGVVPKTYVFGQPDSRQNFQLTHEYMLMHVRFQPGALFQLFRIPMNDLVHQKVEADLIFGADIRDVDDQLAQASDYATLPLILDHYFTTKIRRISPEIRPIDTIGRLILAHPQRFNLAKVADQACLSIRQFENRFTRQIGVTPKYFARICRFYQAYEHKEFNPTIDWLSIALQTGYTDYQHLVKDFKQFAGTTPNTLIEEANRNPERLLNINATFRGV